MPSNPYAALRGLPRDVWVLFWASLANRLGMMAHPFLVLYATGVLGYSAGRAGLLFATFGAGAVLSGPLGGWLSDRLGAARVLAGALLGTAGVLAVFPLVRAPALVFAGVFAWALVGEMGRPASLAVVTERVPPEQRRTAMAAFRLALNLGMSVGPALGGFLAAWSFFAVYWTDALTALVAGVVVLAGLRPRAAGYAPLAAPAAGAVAAPAGGGGAAGSPWRDGRLLAFCAGFGLLLAAFSLQFAPLSLHLVRDLGSTTRAYGLLVTVNTLVVILLEVPVTGRTLRWPVARTSAVGGAFVAAGLLLLLAGTLTGHVLLFAPAILVGAVGEVFAMAAGAPFVADLAPPGRAGAYLGVFSLASSLAFSLGPWLGTVALGHAPAGVLWAGGAAVAGLGVLLTAAAARGAPRPARDAVGVS